MIELEAVVYDDRMYVGKLSVCEFEFMLSAQSDPRLHTINPPVGLYKMIKIVNISPEDYEAITVYGPTVIFFEALAGFATVVKRNTQDRLILALHGGETDSSGLLYPTEGNLRIHNSDLITLTTRIKNQTDVNLLICEEKIGFWKPFLYPKISKHGIPRIEALHRNFRSRYQRHCLEEFRDESFYDLFDNACLLLYLLESNDEEIIKEEESDEIHNTSSELPGPIEADEELPLIVDPFDSEETVHQMQKSENPSDRLSEAPHYIELTPTEDRLEEPMHEVIVESEVQGTSY